MKKSHIRQELCQKRRKLSAYLIKKQSMAAMRQFIIQPLFQRSHKLAAYWPVEGEMDPRFILEKAWENHKQCYLPVLHPFKPKQLLFAKYEPKDRLVQNRYKILEPNLALRKPIAAWHLDIILLPVLAFDRLGNRLGRGAGFYDHTFAYLKRPGNFARPKLIGLAYEFQLLDKIPKETWDIPLTAVITEKRCILF